MIVLVAFIVALMLLGAISRAVSGGHHRRHHRSVGRAFSNQRQADRRRADWLTR